MLSIKNLNGDYLDMPPGTKMELEQANPFLDFSGQVTGDFTLPIEVQAHDKNLKWLQFAGLLQKRIDAKGIDCIVEDNGRQHSIGKLKIERPQVNRANAGLGKVSCYYLSGVASFFQDIKDVLLSEVNFGGNRIWNVTNPLTFWDEPGNFWDHIHQVINAPVGAYDYAFFPFINHAWQGDRTSTTEMNRMVWMSDLNTVHFHKLTTDGKDGNVIVPFPYLHYVLKQAVAHVGWKIEGDIFSDPDFLTVTMENFFAVDWCYLDTGFVKFQGKPLPKEQIILNLQNHMPQITIAAFLNALKNRLGWWYNFDRKNKVIRVQQLQNVAVSGIKDFTRQAANIIPKKAEAQGKIYALKNEFTGEGTTGQPDFKNVTVKGEVINTAQLQSLYPPGQNRSGHVYLAIQENNFMICRDTDENGNWTWELFASNIYDVLPDGYTDEITTAATTIGMEAAPQYGGYVPRYDLAGVWIDRNANGANWGIHLLMYHGPRNVAGGQWFPFATSGVYDNMGVQVSNWSLAFECKTVDGVPVGLYEKQWKKILESLSHPETFEFELYLNINEFLNLKFSDQLVIDAVKMYLTKIKSTVPFTGIILVEAVRII